MLTSCCNTIKSLIKRLSVCTTAVAFLYYITLFRYFYCNNTKILSKKTLTQPRCNKERFFTANRFIAIKSFAYLSYISLLCPWSIGIKILHKFGLWYTMLF